MIEATADALTGVRVVSTGCYLPAPWACARLAALGATVHKLEPPDGDGLATLAPAWYRALHEGQTVERVDLKAPTGRSRLATLLAGTDVLITSSRPGALARLGLDRETLARRHPRLCQVAIVGHAPPDAEHPGHDLGYQARAGLVEPPTMPATLAADLAGAARAVEAVLALLLARSRHGRGGHVEVSLEVAARELAAPRAHGLTTATGLFGGSLPAYGLYPAAEGWVAVTALEPHLRRALADALAVDVEDRAALAGALRRRTAAEWQRWARERGLALVAVAAPVIGAG